MFCILSSVFPMDILFWSGGKDAYLALQLYRQEHPDRELRLLTTYEEGSEVVPYQQIPLSYIRKQASSLELTLIRVPLPAECPDEKYLQEVGKALTAQDIPAEHLIFGDWHLQEIRQWREEVFGAMGYDCLFPIWRKNIHELLPVLQLKSVKVEISAVRKEFQSFISIGETFDQPFVIQLQHLSEDIDPMGENGEFHTKVIFREADEGLI